MKKHAAKTVIILFELCAILIAAGAAGAIYLYWLVSQGPVSLDLFQSSAGRAIERQLPPGFNASLSGLTLSQGDARGDYVLAVGALSIKGPDGVETASAEETSFLFSAGDVFAGAWGPRFVNSTGATFNIFRNADLEMKIPGAPVRESISGARRLPNMLNGGILKSAFQEARLDQAEVFFRDETSGRMWRTKSADVVVSRDDGGVKAKLAGEIDMDGTPAAINIELQYTEESDTIALSCSASQFPVGDALSTFYGENSAFIDASLTGAAEVLLTGSGDVLSSTMEGSIEGGRIRIGGVEKTVSHIEWETSFDPGGNDFSIERFAFDIEGAQGDVDGVVRIAFADDIRQPRLVLFDVSVNELSIEEPEALPEPLTFDTFRFAGGYQVQDRNLKINEFQSRFLDVDAEGAIDIAFPRAGAAGLSPAFGLTGNLGIDGALDPQQLLQIWPRGLAMGARDWVRERLPQAVIDNIRADFNIIPGSAGDGGLPDDAVTVTFDVRDAVAYYVKAMTPLTDAAGKGVLRGNSFTLTAEEGRVGTVSISDGEIAFPEFYPKWRPTYYRFTASGASQDMLSVLDQEPMQLLSKVDLSPAQFSGETSARIEIMRPNKRDVSPEDYIYKGTARFDEMTINGLAGDVELTKASGGIDISTRSMRVEADALLANDAPISLVWNQNFFETDGPSTIEVSGEIDASTGDLFGIPSRQFLHGPVRFSAKAAGRVGTLETLDLTADFKDASLTADALAWRKPAGVAATGDLSLRFMPDTIAIEKIDITGENIGIEGQMAFAAGGGLRSADFKRFYLTGAADFSLKAERDNAGGLSMTAIGEYLNAAPMIEEAISAPGHNNTQTSENVVDAERVQGPGFALTARIDRLSFRNNVEYRDAALDLRRSAGELQALDFSAIGQDGAPLQILMELTGAEEGPARMIEARSSAIGDLLGGVFGMSSIFGGEGTLQVGLPRAGEQKMVGVFEARDLQVVNAPLLARIFSAGSLDGLSNLMNGKGIDFNYAYGEFDYAEGVLMIDNARATGPSVGITAEGGVATGEGGEISLVGAVAPIYQLNSVLGNAPIIGDILVGKKGEGVLALSYSVSGETASPSVFVNPLSALTPGVFRQLMQPPSMAEQSDEEQAAPPAPQPQ